MPVDCVSITGYNVFTVIKMETNMNERIRAFYKKAHEDGYLNKTFNPEKFAELIVQECASIFEGVYTDQQRPERIDTRIKEHFGVE